MSTKIVICDSFSSGVLEALEMDYEQELKQLADEAIEQTKRDWTEAGHECERIDAAEELAKRLEDFVTNLNELSEWYDITLVGVLLGRAMDDISYLGMARLILTEEPAVQAAAA